jgi:hypothetical protein
MQGWRRTRKPLLETAILRTVVLLGITLVLLLPGIAAAGGGKPATKVYNVADTRGLQPGITKWIGDVYNGNPWIFGLIVVGVMAGMGLVLGFGMDRLLRMLGLNLGKLQHHE